MKTQTLSIDVLTTDGDTQNRISINEETVEDYAELISESEEWPLGPLDVFHDGNNYFVADGFHRTMAAQRAKRASIPCRIRRGTAKDARIFGMTANDQHGLRMTRADKRCCVEWLLDNEKSMTQKEIASKSGVSKRLVQMIVSERKSKKAQIAPSDEPSSDKGKPGGGVTSSSVSSPVEDDPVSSSTAADTESAREQGPETGGEDRSQTEVAPPADSKQDPEQEFRTQRSKTVKTVEAAMRAFDDLNRLRKREDDIDWAINACKALIQSAKNW